MSVRFVAQSLAILLAIVLAFAGRLCALTAQAPNQQGPPIIRSIEIQYVGPETVSKERVLAQIRTKAGQPYSESLAEQDIRALYATGAVQNVRIFAEPQGDGVKVIVVLQTRSLVHEIEIVGAEQISAKKLRKNIDLKINRPLNEEELEKGRQKIIDIYQAKGFTNVDVKFHVDTDEAHGTSRVVYTINEGPKGTISAIHFEGNTKFSDRTLRKQMKTKGKTLYSFIDKSGRLDETQLEQDLNAVREWYQDHGYIDVEIKEVRRERSKGKMTIVVVLAEGRAISRRQTDDQRAQSRDRAEGARPAENERGQCLLAQADSGRFEENRGCLWERRLCGFAGYAAGYAGGPQARSTSNTPLKRAIPRSFNESTLSETRAQRTK